MRAEIAFFEIGFLETPGIRIKNMRSSTIVSVLLLTLAWLGSQGMAAEKASGTSSSAEVNKSYPGLLSGSLTHAVLGNLPRGVILEAGDLRLSEKDLQEKITRSPVAMREELGKNAPFVLEQMARENLLAQVAKLEAAKRSRDVSKMDDNEAIRDYLDSVTDKMKVDEGEIDAFYKSNEDKFLGVKLDQAKSYIRQYLVQQKKQELIYREIETVGQKIPIRVSSSWAKEKASSARDNPLDRARWGGKPTFAAFGAKSCCGPDKMIPIVDALRENFGGKINVLYIEVKNEKILAARNNIQSIPAQVFYTREGKEFYRHSGAMSFEEIDLKLTEMGVE